jgi:hypothetical protein
MKKIVALILASLMILCLVSCSAEKTEGASASTPVELLNQVWGSYAEDEKFPVAGGDMTEENSNMEGPGVYGLEDKEGFVATTHFPEAELDKIDSAATLMHMMNANTMTVFAVEAKEGTDLDALAGKIKESIEGTQWMCGFPEKLCIITEGNIIVSYFGNGEVVDTFTKNLKAEFSSAKVFAEAPIVA